MDPFAVFSIVFVGILVFSSLHCVFHTPPPIDVKRIKQSGMPHHISHWSQDD